MRRARTHADHFRAPFLRKGLVHRSHRDTRRADRRFAPILAVEALEQRIVLDAHSLGGVTFLASNDFSTSSNGFGVNVQGGKVAIGFEPVGGYAANPDGFLALLRVDLDAYGSNPGKLAINDSGETFDLSYANLRLIDRASFFPNLYTNSTSTAETISITEMLSSYGVDLTSLSGGMAQSLPVAGFGFTPESFLIVDNDPTNDTTDDTEVWFQGKIDFTSLQQSDANQGHTTVLPTLSVDGLDYVKTSPVEGFNLDGATFTLATTSPIKMKGMEVNGFLNGSAEWVNDGFKTWHFSIYGGIKSNDQEGLLADAGVSFSFSLADGNWSSLGVGISGGTQSFTMGTVISSSASNPLGAFYDFTPGMETWGFFGEVDMTFKGSVDNSTVSLILGYVSDPGMVFDANANLLSFNGSLAADIHLFGAEFSTESDPLTIVYSRDEDEFQISGTVAAYIPSKANAQSKIQLHLGDGVGNTPGFTITRGQLNEIDAAITGSFNVNGLTWGVNDARFEWNSETDEDSGDQADRFIISGELFFRELWSVDIVLGSSINGANSGLRVENGNYYLDAFSVTVSNVNLGFINVKDFEVKYGPDPTSGDTTVLVAANVFFPKTNIDVEAEITYDITARTVSQFSFGLEAGKNKRIPIADTGLFLVAFYVDVENLNQPSNFVVTGDVTVEYGEKLSLGPLGSNVVLAAATGQVTVTKKEFVLDVNAWFGATRKAANPGDFKIEYSTNFGQGEGTLTLDWGAHLYELEVSASLFADSVELDVTVEFDGTASDYYLYFQADAKIKVPSVVPFVGGKTLGEMAMVLDIHATKGQEENSYDGFLAAWVDVNLIFKKVGVGFEADIGPNGFQDVRLIGQKEIDNLKAGDYSPSAPTLYTYSTQFQANGTTQDGDGIPAQADEAYFQVQVAAIDANIADLKIEFRPYNSDGTLPPHNDAYLVPAEQVGQTGYTDYYTLVASIDESSAFPTAGGKVHPLRDDIPGVFDFYIQTQEKLDPETEIVWQVTYSSPAPEVELVNAGGLRSGISTEPLIYVPVTYDVADGLASQTTITLFVDTDDNGYDGVKAASFTPSSDSNVGGTPIEVPVNLTGLPYGNYWFYAKIDDGRNVPVFSRYSWQVPLRPQVESSTVTIIDASPVASGFTIASAIDANPLTDYVNTGGPGAFLDFDFGAPVRLGQVVYTDRVTSGGGNGTFYGGVSDMTTAYSYTISIDDNFTNGDGITDDVQVTLTGIPTPIDPKQPSDFSTSLQLPGIAARYLRWQVAESLGSDVGASNFAFYLLDENGANSAKDGFAPAGPISGRVIDDLNNVGVPGLPVYLDTNGDGVFDASSEPEWTTDGFGYYRFDHGIFKFADDIGAVGFVGSASALGGDYVVRGSGADIYGTSDEFQFVHTSSNGDSEIVARVASVSDTNEWTKAGVMFRDGTGPTAAHVLLLQRPDNQVSLQWRDAAGQEAEQIGPLGGTTSVKWLKLSRTYDATTATSTFTASYSTDGTNWTTVGTHTNSIPESAEVGIAVTAHDNTKLATALFNDVQITTASGGSTLPGGAYAIGVVGVEGLTFVPSPSGGATTNPQLIEPGTRPFNGDSITAQANPQLVLQTGTHSLTFEQDGRLHLYSSGKQTWQSDNSGVGNFVSIQGDGNLVIYGSSGPVWATNTADGELGSGKGGRALVLSANGNLLVNNAEGGMLWETTTSDPLNVDTNFGFTIGTSIAGVVYNDVNQNGIQDFGERPAQGWKVFADLNDNGVLDADEPAASTSSDGAYRIFDLPTGVALTFPVRIDPASLPGYFTTSPQAISVTLDASDPTQFVDNLSFGVLEYATVSGTIGNYYLSAARIGNGTVSIIGSAPANPGNWSASYAIDTDASSPQPQLSDYVSNNMGVDTYLAFDLGAAYYLTSIDYTDRVTSGNPAGNFNWGGGTSDFTTGYTYTLSVDNDFTNGDGVTDDITVSVSGLTPPINPTVNDFAAFTSTANVNVPYAVRYIRWDVDTITGGSPRQGASDFGFYGHIDSPPDGTTAPPPQNWQVDLLQKEILTPTSVAVAQGSQYYPAEHLIDNSGLSGVATAENVLSITHASTSDSNSWVTNTYPPSYYSSGGVTPVLVFQLGGTYTLTDLATWNYDVAGNATRQMKVEFSTDGGKTFTGNVRLTIPQAAGPANVLSFGASYEANAVRVTFLSNYINQGSGGDRVGLNELKFLHSVVKQTTTASTTDGSYTFTNVIPGNYTVRQVVPPGWSEVSPVTFNGGTFDPSSITFPSATVQGSTVFDFNNDGYDDIAVLYTAGGSFYVDVFLNESGTGKYQRIVKAISQSTSATPFRIEALAHGLSSDSLVQSGNLGVFATNGDVWLYSNSGLVNGAWQGFVMKNSYSSPGSIFSVAVGDVDNDGITDTISSRNGYVDVSSSYQKNNNGQGYIPYAIKSPGQIALGDMNGDGNLDIVIGASISNANRQTLSIGFGSGDGLFTFSEFYLNGTEGIGGPDLQTRTNLPIAIADVNSDGLSDIVFGFFNNESVDGGVVLYEAKAYYVGYLVQDQAGGFLARATRFAGTPPMQALAVGEIGGGAYPDVAFLWKDLEFATYSQGIFYGSSQTVYGVWSPTASIQGPPANPVDLHLVDLNRDGRLDMVSTDSSGTLYIYTNELLRTDDIAISAGPGTNPDNDFTNAQQGQVSGVVYADDNYSGTLQSGESPRPNLRIFLDIDGDLTYDPGEISTYTNDAGVFAISGLTDGTYTLAVELPDTEVVFGPSKRYSTFTIAGGVVQNPADVFQTIGVARLKQLNVVTNSVDIGKDWTLRRNGSYLELLDSANDGLLERVLIDQVHGFTILASNYTADSVTIDLASGGPFALPGTIHVDGGRDGRSGGSTLRILVSNSEEVQLIPGTAVVNNALTITWTDNLANVDVINQTPPRVVGLSRLGYHAQPTRLVVGFDQPMDQARAEDASNYTLTWLGPDGRLGTRDDRDIAIRASTYDATTQSVTIRPERLLPLRALYQLTIDGSSPAGLISTSGVLLDGAMTGDPGTNYVVTFGSEILTIPAAPAPVSAPPTTFLSRHQVNKIRTYERSVRLFARQAERLHRLDLQAARREAARQRIAALQWKFRQRQQERVLAHSTGLEEPLFLNTDRAAINFPSIEAGASLTSVSSVFPRGARCLFARMNTSRPFEPLSRLADPR